MCEDVDWDHLSAGAEVNDDNEPDNVISVSFGEKTTVKDRTSDPSRCFHRRYEVDDESRTIACRLCGKVVDAFSVLLEYANEGSRWEHARKRRRELSASVEALLKEEKLIKARLKSASRKDAKKAVADERAKLKEQQRRTAANAREIVLLAQRIVRASGESAELLREVP